MRRSMLLRAALAAAASGAVTAPAALAAQAFEGVIAGTSYVRGHPQDMTIQVKGDRWRRDMNEGGQSGSIIADAQGRVFTVVPSRHMYMQLGPESSGDFVSHVTFTATGKSETVAGYRCSYFHMHDPTHPTLDADVCITTTLGNVGFTPEQRLANNAAVRRQFPNGFFMLKVVDPSGAPRYVVSRVERKPLSDALFAPPAGYREIRMPAAGGATIPRS